MNFKVLFTVAGDHVHCRLFCAGSPQQTSTYAKCGEFVVRVGEEFVALLAAFSGVQFISDDAAGIVEASGKN